LKFCEKGQNCQHFAKWLPRLPQFEVGETVDVADVAGVAGVALSSVFGIVVIVVLLGLGFSGLGLGLLGLGIVLLLLLGILYLTQGLPLRNKLVSLCHIIGNNHLGIKVSKNFGYLGQLLKNTRLLASCVVQRDLTISTFYDTSIPHDFCKNTRL